jgi:replicative DNA helicase
MENVNDISEVVFDPGQIAQLAKQSVESARDDPDTLKTGIAALDSHYVMRRPRKVNGILAYTSHGKTSLMYVLSRSDISQLRENEISLYVTWEDSIEDYGVNFLANASRVPLASLYSGKLDETEWIQMLKAAANRATIPLWAVGHSETTRRARLTITDIYHAMEYIVDKQKKKVRCVYLDYLQRISRADVGKETREGYMAIMDKIKDLALDFNTCVHIGSQVDRDIPSRKWKQPQINDAQETSNFEHTCDGMISLQLPYKWEKMGESLIPKTGDSPAIFVTPRLMLLETLKQKKGVAPVLTAVDFLPQTNEIVPYTPPKPM